MGRPPAAKRPARPGVLALGLAGALLVAASAAAQDQQHRRDANGSEARPKAAPREPADPPQAEPSPPVGIPVLSEAEKRCRAATRGCTMDRPCPPCDR